MKLTLWLPIHTSRSNSTLWWQTRTTFALPGPHDGIVLFMNDDPGEDPQEGPMLTPIRRYMDANGAWHVELQRVLVQPDEGLWNSLRHERSQYLGMGTTHKWVPWWSAEEAERNAAQMGEQGWRHDRMG